MVTTSLTVPILDVQVTFDLSAKPKVSLVNRSTGTQAGAKYIFSLYSPVGLPIHVGSLTTPDAKDAWTTFSFTEDLPTALGSLEFGTYKLVVKVQDAANASFELTKLIPVVRPSGNKVGEKHNYGQGILFYEVRCNTGKIFAEDRSKTSYLGQPGTLVSRAITLDFPPDDTGVSPSAEVVSTYPATNFKIPYNGPGYTLILQAIHKYEVAKDSFVIIRYKDKHCFKVMCNIDLCKVACEVQKFEKKVACSPTPDNERKLLLMSSKLNIAMLGKLQPGCGIDVSKVVEEIIELGGFDCTCLCDYTSGIGTVNDCGCDACKTLATLADKVQTSGNYSIKIDKSATNDCGKVSLVPACFGVTGTSGTITTTP